MSSAQPSKRQWPDNGGAYHDAIPFLEDFHVVHAQEGRLQHVAHDRVWTAPTECSPQRALDRTWTTATSWEPLDDPELALDPNGEWYDEVVSREVMEAGDDIPLFSLSSKQKRSKVSVSNLIWLYLF